MGAFLIYVRIGRSPVMIMERVGNYEKNALAIYCFLAQLSRNYHKACVILLTFATGALFINP